MEPAQEPLDRLFFAVLPTAEAAQRIMELARQLRTRHGLQGIPIDARRLHVSLHDLGDHAGLPSPLITAANEAASRLDMSPFEVRFDHILSFSGVGRGSGRRPIVLCGSGEDIAGFRQLFDGLSHPLLPRGTAGFTPHVTLLYDEQLLAEQSVEPICWTVREVALVHSRLRTGLPYSILGRWRLRGKA